MCIYNSLKMEFNINNHHNDDGKQKMINIESKSSYK